MFDFFGNISSTDSLFEIHSDVCVVPKTYTQGSTLYFNDHIKTVEQRTIIQ